LTLPDRAAWNRAALTFRRRAAAAVLALTAIVYPVAWDADPYIFGIAVLGFVPVQLTLAAAGLLARVVGRDPHTLIAWVVDVLLVAAAAAALAFLRTISWS
jgi:hypothetical protein